MPFYRSDTGRLKDWWSISNLKRIIDREDYPISLVRNINREKINTHESEKEEDPRQENSTW